MNKKCSDILERTLFLTFYFFLKQFNNFFQITYASIWEYTPSSGLLSLGISPIVKATPQIFPTTRRSSIDTSKTGQITQKSSWSHSVSWTEENPTLNYLQINSPRWKYYHNAIFMLKLRTRLHCFNFGYRYNSTSTVLNINDLDQQMRNKNAFENPMKCLILA